MNGFQADFHVDGLEEVTPQRLVQYIANYTDWDLVGARYTGHAPLSMADAMRYPIEVTAVAPHQSGVTAKTRTHTQTHTCTQP